MSSVNAEQWVREAQQGDVAAFERLYRAYVDRIYGLCFRMMVNHGDAEDCVQNTFINAWRRLDQFRGRSDFGTWLHRIAVNEVLIAKRRRPLAPNQPRGHEPEATASGLDIALDLDTAIAGLPDQARQVFVLRAIYGHSHDELAALLGLASGTVRAHYHHARQVLKQQLGLEDSDD